MLLVGCVSDQYVMANQYVMVFFVIVMANQYVMVSYIIIFNVLLCL
jgi:hypothetical protein